MQINSCVTQTSPSSPFWSHRSQYLLQPGLLIHSSQEHLWPTVALLQKERKEERQSSSAPYAPGQLHRFSPSPLCRSP